MKYLLIAMLFHQTPQSVEVKYTGFAFNKQQQEACETKARALNLEAVEKGERKLHVCMPYTPSK